MLPKTKPADEDVLNWWDKTIEMCTKRADGIEMCIDDLATAVREQRQTIEGLRLSLEMERNSTVERLLTDEKELALVKAAFQKAGWLPPPQAAELESALAGHRALDQTYALTDAEAQVAELEPDARLGKALLSMPVYFRLAHEWGESDKDGNPQDCWVVLKHSIVISYAPNSIEALQLAQSRESLAWKLWENDAKKAKP